MVVITADGQVQNVDINEAAKVHCAKCGKEIIDYAHIVTEILVEERTRLAFCKTCKRALAKFCEKPLAEFEKKLVMEFLAKAG